MWHPFGERHEARQQHIKLVTEQAMWNTAITRTYGVDYPFIGAGMAMIAEPQLVAAVSLAGGIGQLGTGPLPPPLLRGLIREVRVLMRPWPVVTIFRDAMYKALSGSVPADFWELQRKPVNDETPR